MSYFSKREKGFTHQNFAKQNLGGFTLMEILVYIAVLVIILLAVLAFLNWATKSNTKARATKEVADNGKLAMETMVYEIKQARAIYSPTATTSQLSLETSHYLPEGETTSYIDFFLCATTTLCFKKEGEDPLAITSEKVEVNNLEFIYISSNKAVQINLGLNYKNPQNRSEQTATLNLTSSASLRSY